jgi:anthranilate phosphoribosyltransferase
LQLKQASYFSRIFFLRIVTHDSKLMDITKLLNKLLEKQDLTTSETKAILTAVMNGDVLPTQIAAILVALRMKGETTDEIVGFIQAMRDQMVKVDVKDAIDVCGTGGDGSNSINISTAVSLVVAACGVKVAKHGNRAASSKSGAADVLESLGVEINLSAEQAKEVIEKVGMVFLFAPNFHPATKHVAVVRKALKIRTIFNFLGPFVNPAATKKQLIGVPSKDAAKQLIAVGKKLDYERLVLVASDDGMDEVSLSASTYVFEIENGQEKEFIIDPKEYGFKAVSKEAITGGSAEENAEFLKEILDGRKGPKRDIVILNSAVALYAAGKVADIQEGITLAEKAIVSGAAKKVLENLIKETNKYAQ